ncbi:MAG: hypothetical protein IJ934_03045 [Acetobacter sp.]|nr:hypothetical protein [Acetobacter sp.]
MWAFLEVISFGKFIYFYDYCANKLNNESNHYDTYGKFFDENLFFSKN